MFLSKYFLNRKINTVIFITLLLISAVPILSLPTASAADPTLLTRKWTGYVAGGGEALLIANIRPDVPGEEIVHVGGGVQPASGPGRVSVLRASDGVRIASVTHEGIGDTCQAQMADVDNDDRLEIIVPLQQPAGLVIYNSEDLSILWEASGSYSGYSGYFTNPDGGRCDSSPVIGDIDDDGYADIFISSMAYALTPATGTLRHLEYDPEAGTFVQRHMRVVWHPCAGGLSLADTDTDGRWELYMADRGQTGFQDGAWGRGLRSFWADDLTSRWDVYDNHMSSNIPMIADVNKDGILDIVATDLSRAVLVADSATGQILVNDDGRELRGSISGRANHYQSSVYDIDDDGNLEVISADGWEGSNDYFSVFDLWDWTLDAQIDTTAVGDEAYIMHSWKGPTVGEVTGDGLMDIIVTCYDVGLTNHGMVQVYDRNYQLVAYTANNLQHRAIESVVQDADGDGVNELYVLTQGGQVYCYYTAGLSEVSQGRERARTEVQFYSERRLGASEYVPYEYDESPKIDSRASIAFPIPGHWEFDVSASITDLSFTLNHPLNELMDYTVSYWDVSDPTTLLGSDSGTDVGNGVYTLSVADLTTSTSYGWNVEVTDESGHLSSKDYGFTTENSVPGIAGADLSGGSELEDLVASPTNEYDTDGDDVSYTYRWTKDGSSIANLILPFNTMTDLQSEYGALAYTYDYSGSSNDGDVIGATWTDEGKVGGAYSFDGDNDLIRIEEQGSSLGGDGNWDEISVEFWVKATADTSTRGEPLLEKIGRPYGYGFEDEEDILPEWSYTGYRVDFSADSTTDTITWRIYTENPEDEENPFQFSVTANIGARDDWHHVVCTYTSGEGLKIYADGVEVNTLPGVNGNILRTNINTNTQNLGNYIGDWGHTMSSIVRTNKGPLNIEFGGMLDELKIYPREIGAHQAYQNYMDTVGDDNSQSTISKYATTPDEVWRCYITPNDGLTDGLTIATSPITILDVPNTAPVASGLAITPVSPITGDDLVATYTYYDEEGHAEVGSLIEWYRNGVPAAIGPLLPSSETAKAESWTFYVTPNDGFNSGIRVGPSEPVIIGNTPPSFTSIVISPNPAFEGNTLIANSYGFSDPDADAIEGYTYQWQKLNGAIWEDISGETSQTLASSNFVSGDYVKVLATVNDGEDTGNTVEAETWIVDSTLPTVDDANLVSSSGSNRDDDDLTCTSVNPQDAEEDVTVIYKWLKNGVSSTNLLMPFDISSITTAVDYSGYTNHGTVYGATPTGAKVGGGYSFDGNDYILVNEQDDSLGSSGTWTALSVEFWVLASNLGQESVVSLHDANYSLGGWMGDPYGVGYSADVRAYSNRDRFYWTVITDQGTANAQFTDYDTYGVWRHVIYTYEDGVGLKLYVDGVERASAALSGTIASTAEGTLYIGGTGSGSDFSGLLDEVKIYPTALSAAQIFQNYADSADGAVESTTIVPQETSVGDAWSCQVTPNDGWQNGSPDTSDPLTVGSGNTLPHIDYYSPVEAAPEIIVGESLDFMIAASDPNDDTLTYKWFLDSVEQVGETQPTWTYSPLSGSIHTVRVEVTDGINPVSHEWSVNVGAACVLTVNTVGQGSVTLDPAGGSYTEGTLVTLTADPAAGWTFSEWSGDVTSVDNPLQITIPENTTVTATFTQDEYTLDVTVVGFGSVNKNPDQATYHYGDIISLTAIPDNADWAFSGWTSDVESIVNPLEVTITGNTALTATFTDDYVLTVDVIGSGTVTMNPDQQYYTDGTNVELTANPAEGWSFSGWSGDLTGDTNPETITMNEHKSITATFTQDEYALTINISPTGSGSVSATSPGPYHYGDTVTLTPTANSDYEFAGWTGDGINGVGNTRVITFTDNAEVTATFTQKPPYLFDDDFESGNFAGWSGSATEGTGSTAIVTTNNPHNGDYSGQFAITAGTGGTTRRAYSTINLDGLSEVYAWAYVYIPNDLSLANGQKLFVIRYNDAAGAALASYGVVADASGMHWAVQYAGWPVGLGTSSPSGGAWYLMEAYLSRTDTEVTLTLSVNDEEVATLTYVASTTPVNSAWFGSAYYTGAGALTVYVDAVAINDEDETSSTTYNVNLQSEQNNAATSNIGTITCAGTNYNLPGLSTQEVGVYTIQYNPADGYSFDHWESTGAVSVTDTNAVSTTVTVSGDGTLTAVYVIEAEGMVLQDETSWYWTSDTEIAATATGDVDGDGQIEIVTVGYYNDGIRDNAQLVVWDQSGLSVENVISWYWTDNTKLDTVAIGDVDGDGLNEIVTGGGYFDGVNWNAQLCVWDGATLTLDAVTGWCWTSDTEIHSVTLSNISRGVGLDIVTGGAYNDGSNWNAQLCIWNGTTLALQDTIGWLWGSGSVINSVAVGDLSGTGVLSIVTGGEYFDGSNWNAQLCTWDAASLTLNNVVGWLWTGNTEINSVAVADINGGSTLSIIVGGSYADGVRTNAQLSVWNGETLTLENVVSWFTESDTSVNSVVAADFSDGLGVEIVTAGFFNDGYRDNAQLICFDGASLASVYSTSWFTVGDTVANSVAVCDFGAGSCLVVGGSFFDTCVNAELTIWK